MTGRRARRRRRSRGFTLLELMVVVMLVAILAVLAVPSMSQAREDRLAFDYARQYQQLLSVTRSRAAGTGAAHLALLGPGTTGRGFLRVYEALDGVPPAPVAPFNPVSSCRLNPNQWDMAAVVDPPVLTDTAARFVDHVDLNHQKNANMDLRSVFTVGPGTAGGAMVGAAYVAICMTPTGTTYVGSGGAPGAAIAAMRTSPPFTGIAMIQVQRHSAGAPIGLLREVIITGGGAPRLRSH